jgi:hypothetical protein
LPQLGDHAGDLRAAGDVLAEEDDAGRVPAVMSLNKLVGGVRPG